MENWAYEDVLAFTRSWDAVYFTIVFAVALGYALWPSNRAKFERAAQLPLHDDGDAP
ncbi:MAG: cbb3-type cytochrome c oxidase subunit 3 [Rhizomicrobium sp.]